MNNIAEMIAGEDMPKDTRMISSPVGPMAILQDRRKSLEEKLSKVNEAIKVLEQEPKLSHALDVLTRGLKA